MRSISSLFKLDLPKKTCLDFSKNNKQIFIPNSSKISVKRVFEKVDSVLNENLSVIADAGSLFFASNLLIHSKYGFVGSSIYYYIDLLTGKYIQIDTYSNSGFNITDSTGKKVNMYNIETNELVKSFNSLSKAQEYIKCPHTMSITQCCRGKIKSYYGYKWKYVDNSPS